jgi:hypothetical protein
MRGKRRANGWLFLASFAGLLSAAVWCFIDNDVYSSMAYGGSTSLVSSDFEAETISLIAWGAGFLSISFAIIASCKYRSWLAAGVLLGSLLLQPAWILEVNATAHFTATVP